MEIHAFLTKPATQQIQWGRAGPRVHNADSCALLRRTSKAIGKTKENEGLLCGFEVPPWDVREGIRGDRIPVTVSQNPFKPNVKTNVSDKTRYPANSMGPFAPGPLWILYPFATDRDRAPRKAHMRKTIGETKGSTCSPAGALRSP